MILYHLLILQVSDVDSIMGCVQYENIQVHAEAYDVALDMSFPKGNAVRSLFSLVSSTE